MILADILGVGRKKFAESIGMTYSSFTGKAKCTPLNSNAIANILESYPEVNVDWLLTGVGEALKGGNTFYPGSLPSSNEARDIQVQYTANQGIVDQPTLQMVMEDHQTHNEIVLSQQRTIEKLVDILKKEK